MASLNVPMVLMVARCAMLGKTILKCGLIISVTHGRNKSNEMTNLNIDGLSKRTTDEEDPLNVL